MGLITDAIKVENKDAYAEQSEDAFNDENFDKIQFDDDDEDNENAISVERLKRQIMGSPEPELKDLAGGEMIPNSF